MGCDFVEDGVAAGDDETNGWELGWAAGGAMGFEEYGVDVPCKVIDGDERFVQSGGESLCIGDADKECAGEAGALGDGDGVYVGELQIGLREGFADYGDDLAEVFAGGEFGDDAAVFLVDVDLRGDDVGKDVEAVGDDGGGGFVAGGFDG